MAKQTINIFLFFSCFLLFILYIELVTAYGYEGIINSVIEFLGPLSQGWQNTKLFALAVGLISIFWLLLPAIFAVFSWYLSGKILPLAYVPVLILQLLLVYVAVTLTATSELSFFQQGMPFFWISMLTLMTKYFIAVVITIWLSKQLFDTNDRNIGIEIHQRNNIIFITILMIVIYLAIAVNLYIYAHINIVMFPPRPAQEPEFMLRPPGLKFLIIPVLFSAIYIAIMVAKFRFLKMVIFTRGAIILGSVGSVLNGTVFVCSQGMQIQWAFFLYGIVCDLILIYALPLSLSFWLTLKLLKAGTKLEYTE